MFIPLYEKQDLNSFICSLNLLEESCANRNLGEIHLALEALTSKLKDSSAQDLYSEKSNSLSERVQLVLENVESLDLTLRKTEDFFQKTIRLIGFHVPLDQDLQNFSSALNDKIEDAVFDENFKDLLLFIPLIANDQKRLDTWKSLCSKFKETLPTKQLEQFLVTCVDRALNGKGFSLSIEATRIINPETLTQITNNSYFEALLQIIDTLPESERDSLYARTSELALNHSDYTAAAHAATKLTGEKKEPFLRKISKQAFEESKTKQLFHPDREFKNQINAASYAASLLSSDEEKDFLLGEIAEYCLQENLPRSTNCVMNFMPLCAKKEALLEKWINLPKEPRDTLYHLEITRNISFTEQKIVLQESFVDMVFMEEYGNLGEETDTSQAKALELTLPTEKKQSAFKSLVIRYLKNQHYFLAADAAKRLLPGEEKEALIEEMAQLYLISPPTAFFSGPQITKSYITILSLMPSGDKRDSFCSKIINSQNCDEELQTQAISLLSSKEERESLLERKIQGFLDEFKLFEAKKIALFLPLEKRDSYLFKIALLVPKDEHFFLMFDIAQAMSLGGQQEIILKKILNTKTDVYQGSKLAIDPATILSPGEERESFLEKIKQRKHLLETPLSPIDAKQMSSGESRNRFIKKHLSLIKETKTKLEFISLMSTEARDPFLESSATDSLGNQKYDLAALAIKLLPSGEKKEALLKSFGKVLSSLDEDFDLETLKEKSLFFCVTLLPKELQERIFQSIATKTATNSDLSVFRNAITAWPLSLQKEKFLKNMSLQALKKNNYRLAGIAAYLAQEPQKEMLVQAIENQVEKKIRDIKELKSQITAVKEERDLAKTRADRENIEQLVQQLLAYEKQLGEEKENLETAFSFLYYLSLLSTPGKKRNLLLRKSAEISLECEMGGKETISLSLLRSREEKTDLLTLEVKRLIENKDYEALNELINRVPPGKYCDEFLLLIANGALEYGDYEEITNFSIEISQEEKKQPLLKSSATLALKAGDYKALFNALKPMAQSEQRNEWLKTIALMALKAEDLIIATKATQLMPLGEERDSFFLSILNKSVHLSFEKIISILNFMPISLEEKIKIICTLPGETLDKLSIEDRLELIRFAKKADEPTLSSLKHFLFPLACVPTKTGLAIPLSAQSIPPPDAKTSLDELNHLNILTQDETLKLSELKDKLDLTNFPLERFFSLYEAPERTRINSSNFTEAQKEKLKTLAPKKLLEFWELNQKQMIQDGCSELYKRITTQEALWNQGDVSTVNKRTQVLYDRMTSLVKHLLHHVNTVPEDRLTLLTLLARMTGRCEGVLTEIGALYRTYCQGTDLATLDTALEQENFHSRQATIDLFVNQHEDLKDRHTTTVFRNLVSIDTGTIPFPEGESERALVYREPAEKRAPNFIKTFNLRYVEHLTKHLTEIIQDTRIKTPYKVEINGVFEPLSELLLNEMMDFNCFGDLSKELSAIESKMLLDLQDTEKQEALDEKFGISNLGFFAEDVINNEKRSLGEDTLLRKIILYPLLT